MSNNKFECWHKFLFSVFRFCSFYVCIQWLLRELFRQCAREFLSVCCGRCWRRRRFRVCLNLKGTKYTCVGTSQTEYNTWKFNGGRDREREREEGGGGVKRIEREERVKRKGMYRLYGVMIPSREQRTHCNIS